MAQGTPSIIASGVTIKGDIVTDGEIQLDGAVEGNVLCASLVMGETGTIAGNIKADDLIVRGTVRGEITARAVRLEKSAVLEGDVRHFSLTIESGARITGQFVHVDGDFDKALAETKTTAKPARKSPASNETPDFLGGTTKAAE